MNLRKIIFLVSSNLLNKGVVLFVGFEKSISSSMDILRSYSISSFSGSLSDYLIKVSSFLNHKNSFSGNGFSFSSHVSGSKLPFLYSPSKSLGSSSVTPRLARRLVYSNFSKLYDKVYESSFFYPKTRLVSKFLKRNRSSDFSIPPNYRYVRLLKFSHFINSGLGRVQLRNLLLDSSSKFRDLYYSENYSKYLSSFLCLHYFGSAHTWGVVSNISEHSNKEPFKSKDYKFLKKFPQLIFLFDVEVSNQNLLFEGSLLKIPLFSLFDSDMDPQFSPYPLHSNNDSSFLSRFFIYFFSNICFSHLESTLNSFYYSSLFRKILALHTGVDLAHDYYHKTYSVLSGSYKKPSIFRLKRLKKFLVDKIRSSGVKFHIFPGYLNKTLGFSFYSIGSREGLGTFPYRLHFSGKFIKYRNFFFSYLYRKYPTLNYFKNRVLSSTFSVPLVSESMMNIFIGRGIFPIYRKPGHISTWNLILRAAEGFYDWNKRAFSGLIRKQSITEESREAYVQRYLSKIIFRHNRFLKNKPRRHRTRRSRFRSSRRGRKSNFNIEFGMFYPSKPMGSPRFVGSKRFLKFSFLSPKLRASSFPLGFSFYKFF